MSLAYMYGDVVCVVKELKERDGIDTVEVNDEAGSMYVTIKYIGGGPTFRRFTETCDTYHYLIGVLDAITEIGKILGEKGQE